MIVRNEAHDLEDCIQSVVDIVDQVVVVDTGSSDSTPALAEALGSETHSYEWDDNFSNARNYSLELATSDWILVLDADERIEQRDLEILLAEIENAAPDVMALSMRQLTYCDQGDLLNWQPCLPEEITKGHNGFFEMIMPRVLRRHPQIRFEGRLHELASQSIARLGGRIVSSAVPLHHYGRLDPERLAQKFGHYVDLGRKKIEDNPRDPKAHYELGTQLGELGKLEEAIDVLKSGMQIDPEHSEMAIALAGYYMQTATETGSQLSDAFRLCLLRLQFVPDCSTANYLAGILMSNLGNLQGAQDHLRRALSVDPENPRTALVLAQTLAASGDFREALTWCSFVLQQAPGEVEAGLLKGQCQIALGLTLDAVDTLTTLLEQNGSNTEVLKQLAVAHYKLGNTDQAHQCLVESKQAA